MLHLLPHALCPHVAMIASILPAAAGAFLVRPIRLLGVRESESIMNFSHLGTLSCICAGSDAADHKADRRDVCRTCGLEVIPADPRRLDVLMTAKEIGIVVTRLQSVAFRARNVDIPSSVKTLDQLATYLEENKPQRRRRPPRRPNARVSASLTRVTH